MRRAAKVDANQEEIVAALRRVGASVQSLAPMGHGVPDILVGYFDSHGRHRNILMEIKTEKGRLTQDELEWMHDWRGQCCVVRSVPEALRVIGVEL